MPPQEPFGLFEIDQSKMFRRLLLLTDSEVHDEWSLLQRLEPGTVSTETHGL